MNELRVRIPFPFAFFAFHMLGCYVLGLAGYKFRPSPYGSTTHFRLSFFHFFLIPLIVVYEQLITDDYMHIIDIQWT